MLLRCSGSPWSTGIPMLCHILCLPWHEWFASLAIPEMVSAGRGRHVKLMKVSRVSSVPCCCVVASALPHPVVPTPVNLTRAIVSSISRMATSSGSPSRICSRFCASVILHNGWIPGPMRIASTAGETLLGRRIPSCDLDSGGTGNPRALSALRVWAPSCVETLHLAMSTHCRKGWLHRYR